MTKHGNNSIKRMVLLLVFIFFITLISIISSNVVLNNLNNNYAKLIDNEHSRRRLGRVIIRDIILIERNFYILSSLTDDKEIDFFKEQIFSKTKSITKVLNTLQHGGEYEDILAMNLYDINELIEKYSYTKYGEAYVIEAIDLAPKIYDIEEIATELIYAVNCKLECSDEKAMIDSNKKIIELSKKANSYFRRSEESANKIFHDSHQAIAQLEKEKSEKLFKFKLIYYFIIGSISALNIILYISVYLKIKNIIKKQNASKKELEKSFESTREEKNKISAILQSIGDGVFVLDQNKKIILINKVTEELSGFTENELVGRMFNSKLKFILETTKNENVGFINDVYSKGETSEMTNHTMLVRKNKSKISVADSAAPLKNKAGMVCGCVVVFRDVSKEREVGKMKDEFISIASHQLRTPLTALRWYSDMLTKGKAGKLNQKQNEYLGDINFSTKKLITLVDSLLNISRIESGRLQVDPKPTDLIKLIHSVIKELKAELDKKKQVVECKFIKNIPLLEIDKNLIRQVYINLLTNASKYSPENKKIQLKVCLDKKNIITKISDGGYGIPISVQSHVFEKFFRADNVTTIESEGTGLGLYMVKKVVEVSGGKIWFESKESKGTTFWFSIPLTGSQKRAGEISLTNTQ